jgi:hypothetical protein
MTVEECSDITSRSNEPRTGQYVSAPWIDPTRSEEIAMLVEKLSLAQSMITAPERNRSVSVQTRAGGTYNFKYATLDHIIEKIRGPLTSNGLWFTQIIREDQGSFILDTRLMHASGQWIACQIPLIWDGQGGNQQFGSALTFMRRYSLTSLLGIAAEEDDDANAADGNTITDRKPAPAKPDVMVKATAKPDIVPSTLPCVIGIDNPPDWVIFGKDMMSCLRGAKSYAETVAWKDNNETALNAMSIQAPKLYTNLSLSMQRLMDDMKAKETE